MGSKTKKNQSKNSTSSKSGVFETHTNQNYYYDNPVDKPSLALIKLAGSSLYLSDISETHKEISLISFNKKEFSEKEKRERLILAVEKKNSKDGEQFYIKTGLYAGRITYSGVTFDIQPDCSDALYRHMLKYANHIYIDETDGWGKKNEKNSFPLIEYLFLSSLQRVSVLGLPQEYSKQKYHDLKVHGGLDIQNFIKKDIPFKGKISSQKNERHYVQSIVDVLYAALKSCKGEIERGFKRLSLIKNELSTSYSGKFPSQQTIQNAQNHKSLYNPMYVDFKRTLTFAEIVIRHNTVLPDKSKEAKDKASGYLLDIASLWEVYLETVLHDALKEEWNISSQEELNLYDGCFFARSNYPDFVLQKKDDPSKVIILDAKFKKMGSIKVDEKKRIKNADVDRNDLHQIHSYAGYYREKGCKVVLCGLIYPLSLEKLTQNNAKLYGLDGSKTLFVIDGIYKGMKSEQKNPAKMDATDESTENENSEISEELDKEYSYVKAEKAFINRLQEYLNKGVDILKEK